MLFGFLFCQILMKSARQLQKAFIGPEMFRSLEWSWNFVPCFSDKAGQSHCSYNFWKLFWVFNLKKLPVTTKATPAESDFFYPSESVRSLNAYSAESFLLSCLILRMWLAFMMSWYSRRPAALVSFSLSSLLLFYILNQTFKLGSQ